MSGAAARTGKLKENGKEKLLKRMELQDFLKQKSTRARKES